MRKMIFSILSIFCIYGCSNIKLGMTLAEVEAIADKGIPITDKEQLKDKCPDITWDANIPPFETYVWIIPSDDPNHPRFEVRTFRNGILDCQYTTWTSME